MSKASTSNSPHGDDETEKGDPLEGLPKLPPDFFADVERRVEEKRLRRAKRQDELFNKEIAPDDRVVAWIDILGFRKELLNAESGTEEDFQRVYRKLLRVRQVFDDPAASAEPEELEQGQRAYGREVFSLSDGLIVTTSLSRATAKGHVTDYDLVMSILSDLILAQADCALEGVFVRGGISVGKFYFEDNVLLSPALVRAYELETRKAVHPVIIIEQQYIEALRELKGYKNYAGDAEPSQFELRPFTSPKGERGDDFLHLDYLNFITDVDIYGPNQMESEEYTSGKYTEKERERLFSLYMHRKALKNMIRHKEQVIRAYKSAKANCVRAKYRWLMEYHNRAVESGLTFYPERAMIDLSRFELPDEDPPKSA